MRKILFRAKRFDTDEWIYGYFVQQKNNLGGIHSCIFQNFEEENRWEMKRVRLETVCQYTGLTDKNGRKIFEGDILRSDENKVGQVQWFEEHSAFMIWNNAENKVHFLYDNDFLKIEVIGNIFNNPELIGDKLWSDL